MPVDQKLVNGEVQSYLIKLLAANLVIVRVQQRSKEVVDLKTRSSSVSCLS